MPVTKSNLDDVFTYHPPGPGDPERYTNIRCHAKALAEVILTETPPCADQQAALRLLREAVMTANASIALKGAIALVLAVLLTGCATRHVGYYDGKKYANSNESLSDALARSPELMRVNGQCLMVATLKTGRQVVAPIADDVCRDAVTVSGLARAFSQQTAPVTLSPPTEKKPEPEKPDAEKK